VSGRSDAIAVVGIGAWYPGARCVKELWENILACRTQFRRMIDQRLPLKWYGGTGADQTYGTRAAYIDGFQFDLAQWRIDKQKYAATDVSHWLAMTVALQALQDAQLIPASTHPSTGISLAGARMGVIVGNTLTGEMTRANGLRLRWPFVSKTLHHAAQEAHLPEGLSTRLQHSMQQHFHACFPATTADTLAGSLSNTIAGHISKHWGMQGGAYTVDGACASSLLAVYQACEALQSSANSMDAVLVGGVDISLDPLEIVGFAQAGALTRGGMRVYGKDASGFLPGEGAGFVVLQRLADARRSGRRIYAVVEGWGMSSDGTDGIMAPVVAGQSLALQRAYHRAPYGANDLDFVEGHGTGTPLGDRVELDAIASVCSAAGAKARGVGVTSLKALIGHTKAASGKLTHRVWLFFLIYLFCSCLLPFWRYGAK